MFSFSFSSSFLRASSFLFLNTMSQDYIAKLECSECHQLNYRTTRNKKRLSKVRLELKKLCTKCGTHTMHKETK